MNFFFAASLIVMYDFINHEFIEIQKISIQKITWFAIAEPAFNWRASLTFCISVKRLIDLLRVKTEQCTQPTFSRVMLLMHMNFKFCPLSNKSTIRAKKNDSIF